MIVAAFCHHRSSLAELAQLDPDFDSEPDVRSGFGFLESSLKVSHFEEYSGQLVAECIGWIVLHPLGVTDVDDMVFAADHDAGRAGALRKSKHRRSLAFLTRRRMTTTRRITTINRTSRVTMGALGLSRFDAMRTQFRDTSHQV